MGRTRAMVRVSTLAVALVASFGPAGCADDPAGPGEDALLPARDLVYPGGRISKSHFFEASDDKSIDQDMSSDADLSLTIVFEEAVPVTDVMRWYEERLARAGWGRPFQRPDTLTMRRQLDGIQHSYTVKADTRDEDDPSTRQLFVDYQMAFFSPTTSPP